LCFVQARVMPNVSASWNASLPISVEGEGHAAGVSEEAIDAFPEKALYQDVRAGHQV
jgi:hypothetical protein